MLVRTSSGSAATNQDFYSRSSEKWKKENCEHDHLTSNNDTILLGLVPLWRFSLKEQEKMKWIKFMLTNSRVN